MTRKKATAHKKQVNIRLDMATFNALKRLARSNGMTRTSALTRLIHRYENKQI